MFWTIALVCSALVAFLIAKRFRWDAPGNPQSGVTRPYIAGIVIGTGVGLTLCRLLTEQFGMTTIDLSLLGAIIAYAGLLLSSRKWEASQKPATH